MESVLSVSKLSTESVCSLRELGLVAIFCEFYSHRRRDATRQWTVESRRRCVLGLSETYADVIKLWNYALLLRQFHVTRY